MEQNTTSVVIEQQGENKKRGALAVILAVAFVAMLGIGSTFAYLTWSGNQTPNRFTIDSALTGDLLEPAWTTADKTGKASDGIAIPAAAEQTEKGTLIAKDPYVVNTSKKGLTSGDDVQPGENGYAMIRLTFQKWNVTSKSGSGINYKEEGKYVNMSADEVSELLKVYAFTTETTYTKGTTKAGLNVDSNWHLVDKSGKAINGTPSVDEIQGSYTGSSLYFYYDGIIQSMLKKADGSGKLDTLPTSYPDAATALSKDGAIQSSTTNLFTNVIQVVDAEDETDDNTPFGDFTGDIKGQSQNPGWRVLVDTSLAYAGSDMTKTPSQTVIKALIKAVDDIEVNSDGKNPQNSVSNPDTAYGYLDSDGNAMGSGYANGFTGLPETKWDKQVKPRSYGETTSGY